MKACVEVKRSKKMGTHTNDAMVDDVGTPTKAVIRLSQ